MAAVILAGCAPADVAGSYTGAVTNRDNGCMFSNWTAGAVSQNITMVVTQNGGAVSADVQGVAGLLLAAITGNNQPMVGTVSGNGFVVSKSGTSAATSGTCAYTTHVEARATLNGNALEGTVSYSFRTNNTPDCGFRSGCSSVQAFAFARPPR